MAGLSIIHQFISQCIQILEISEIFPSLENIGAGIHNMGSIMKIDLCIKHLTPAIIQLISHTHSNRKFRSTDTIQ